MKKQSIQGIIFDYGGTIDTNSRHWAEVLWEAYVHFNVPVSKTDFRTAYVFGERALAKTPYIRPEHDFYDVQVCKVRLQLEELVRMEKLHYSADDIERTVISIATYCNDYVVRTIDRARPLLQALASHYPLVLVSNFYGNIETILMRFGLRDLFGAIVESSVVGVRKPDPAIYRLGVEAMGKEAGAILVVGDSFSKDVVPAKTVGCQVAWLKGEGWGDEEIDASLPDYTITDILELKNILSIEVNH